MVVYNCYTDYGIKEMACKAGQVIGPSPLVVVYNCCTDCGTKEMAVQAGQTGGCAISLVPRRNTCSLDKCSLEERRRGRQVR